MPNNLLQIHLKSSLNRGTEKTAKTANDFIDNKVANKVIKV